MNEDNKNPKDFNSLDNILRERYHGAVNIRGIRYQILYSIYCSLQYYHEENYSIKLEGIEDLDLKSIKQKNTYIQVKTSSKMWTWNQYKEVFDNFSKVFKEDNKADFILVSNFQHNNDWQKIINPDDLSKNERKRLEKKVKNINRDFGVDNSSFYNRIKLVTLREGEILDSINRYIFDIYIVVPSNLIPFYRDALFSKFVEIAEKRGIITKNTLDSTWKELNENIARLQEYSAYGQGLISKLEWRIDQNIHDFYDGKRVRSGHIAAQIDIPRLKWLEKIDQAIKGTNICIIRASSGQGKSTLLYRYAYDYWNERYIYILRSSKSPRENELIKEFLKSLRNFDFPILLLIDNADLQIALWPEIAGYCSEIGIKVLVSIRHEDWFRLSDPNVTNYEIIQPYLDTDEAKDIFISFQKRGKIHQDTSSYLWAYEKIDEPKLLLEYVYLLTHGEMLWDRLKKQVENISELREDKSKIEILRLVSAADLLGSTVKLKKLISLLSFNLDPQMIFESLLDEYIEIKGDEIQGLHWIRSKHLASLLHGKICTLTDTAIKILKIIPVENLSLFISNCVVNGHIDNVIFLKSLASDVPNHSLNELELVFLGLFLGGEKQYFINIKSHFDEAFELLGQSGVSLLGMSTTPTKMINAIEDLKRIKTNETIDHLDRIALNIKNGARGEDLCKEFSKLLNREDIQDKFNKKAFLSAPSIFYWLKLIDFDVTTITFQSQFSNIVEFIDIDERAFFKLISGLYEYKPDVYSKWYNTNKAEFHSFLMYLTDTIDLKINNDELKIKFIPFINSHSSNEDAIKILNKLREALPFCAKYSSDAVNLLPLGLEPSINDLKKRIPVKNLPLEFYTKLNRYWLDILENAYLPDTFFIFEETHFKMRSMIVEFLTVLTNFFRCTYLGKRYDLQFFLNKDNLIGNIKKLLDTIPDPPNQCNNEIKRCYRELTNKCQFHFRNFYYQFFYITQENKDDQNGKLALHNLKKYRKHLIDLYNGFETILGVAPIYFRFSDLRKKEIEIADDFIDLFEYFIGNKILPPIYDYKKRIDLYKNKYHSTICESVRQALCETDVVIPDHVYIDFPLTYLPLYFSIENPIYPEDGLQRLLNILEIPALKPDFYYLIPIYQNRRIIPGGYKIATYQSINDLSWESFVPQEIPNEIMALLPTKEILESEGFSFRSFLIGTVLSFETWMKQFDLFKNTDDDFFLEKLNEKILRMFNDTYTLLKKQFVEIINKYSKNTSCLTSIFSGLNVKEIFSFIEEFNRTESPINGMQFVTDNFVVWKNVIEYFTINQHNRRLV